MAYGRFLMLHIDDPFCIWGDVCLTSFARDGARVVGCRRPRVGRRFFLCPLPAAVNLTEKWESKCLLPARQLPPALTGINTKALWSPPTPTRSLPASHYLYCHSSLRLLSVPWQYPPGWCLLPGLPSSPSPHTIGLTLFPL